MRAPSFFIALVSLLFIAATAHAEPPNAKTLLEDAKQNFQPIVVPSPGNDSVTAARIELGRRLFFENRVSMDGNVSCAHCHLPDKQASDGLPKAIGVFGKENPRNAPSIFNAALNFKQHWRGERESLEDQAEKSLLGPASFGNPDQATAMSKLKAIPAYAGAFAKAFPGDKDPINSKNWGVAVGAFERTLADALQIRRLPCGRRFGADESRAGRAAQIHRSGLRLLPQWRGRRRQFLPEIWRRERLLEGDRSRDAGQRSRGRHKE